MVKFIRWDDVELEELNPLIKRQLLVGENVMVARVLLQKMASDLEDLKWGLEQVRVGKIKPALDRTLPLHQAAEAHRLISTNQVTGNLVLLPWAE